LGPIVVAAVSLVGCSSSGATGGGATTTTAASSGSSASAPSGLVAYVDEHGIEVADPQSGAVRLVVPVSSLEIGNASGQRYTINGPVWASTPTAAHPVIYFALHDLQAQAGAADVFMRADPFAGTLTEVAAVPDATGSTYGLATLPGALAFTFGCCEDLFVETMPLSGGTPRVISPTGTGFWESLGGSSGGQVAVVHQDGSARSYFWLDSGNGTTHPLAIPAPLGRSDSVGVVTVDGSGRYLAVAAGSTNSGQVGVIDLHTGALRMTHPTTTTGDGLAFSPDGSALALTSGGALQVLATAPGATAPGFHLPDGGGTATGVSWSAPISADGFGDLRTVAPSAATVVEQADRGVAASTTTTPSSTSTSTTVSSTTTSNGAGGNPSVTTTPELYVETGADPGTLYPEPHFPDTIVVDNHDYISGLQWSAMGAPTSLARGTLNIDDCQPNCASGHFTQHPIQLTASQPRHCIVRSYDPGRDDYRTYPAYVYNSLVAHMAGGDQSSTPQFSAACA